MPSLSGDPDHTWGISPATRATMCSLGTKSYALFAGRFHLIGGRGVENVFEIELTAAEKGMFEPSFQLLKKTLDV